MSGPSRIDNLRESGWKPERAILGAALLLAVGVAGVAVVPSLRQGTVRADLEDALARLRRAEALEDEVATAGADEEQRLHERAAALLRGTFPTEMRLVETYGRVRLASDLCCVTLDQLDFVGERAPLGPSSAGRWVHAATLELTGSATLNQLVRLVAVLRAGGQPVLVTRVHLYRESVTDARFQFELQLGYPHLGDPPESAEDPAGGGVL